MTQPDFSADDGKADLQFPSADAPERTLGFISSIQINADCGAGELLRPAGLAVEKSGNVIVVDSGNNRLQVFEPDGTFVGKCGRAGNGDGEFNEPWGITLDKDGNIHVADWKHHRVQKLSRRTSS